MLLRIVAIILVANFGILVANGSVIKAKPGIRFLEPILKCYGDGQNDGMARPQSGGEIIKMVCLDMKVGTAVTLGPKPLFQSEAKCQTIDIKMIFHSHSNKTHFQKKSFALSPLALKSEADHKNRHNDHSFQIGELHL